MYVYDANFSATSLLYCIYWYSLMLTRSGSPQLYIYMYIMNTNLYIHMYINESHEYTCTYNYVYAYQEA